MTPHEYLDFYTQVTEDVDAIASDFAAKGQVDGEALKKLRERCLNSRRRAPAKAMDVRLAICEVAGAAGGALLSEMLATYPSLC